MALKRSKEFRGKSEVPLHEFCRIFWTVHAGKIEHEVGARAPIVQLPLGAPKIVFVNLERQQRLISLTAILTVANILQRLAKIPSHETLRTGYENSQA